MKTRVLNGKVARAVRAVPSTPDKQKGALCCDGGSSSAPSSTADSVNVCAGGEAHKAKPSGGQPGEAQKPNRGTPQKSDPVKSGSNRNLGRRKLNRVEIFQLNVHKSNYSAAAFSKQLYQPDMMSVGLVQEPWHQKGKVGGLKGPNHILFQVPAAADQRPRAAVICSKELRPVLLNQLSSLDIVAVQTTVGLAGQPDKKIVFVSAYLAGDEPIPEDRLRAISDFCLQTESELVLGADANSHHGVFGSSDTNPRGEALVQLLASLNWDLLNRGNDPTFVTACRAEVLDITVSTGPLTSLVHDWRVSKEPMLSDHHLIWCTLARVKIPCEWRRQVKRTDWEAYGITLSQKLPAVQSPQTPEEVEQYARSIEGAIRGAFHEACPAKRVTGQRAPP